MEPFTLREGPVAVRPLRPQDAPLLLSWMQNPQVLAFYGGRDMAYTPEKIQEDFYAPEEAPAAAWWSLRAHRWATFKSTSWTPSCARNTTTPISRGSSSLA